MGERPSLKVECKKRGRSGTRSDLAELAFFVYFFWQCKKVKASRGLSDKARSMSIGQT